MYLTKYWWKRWMKFSGTRTVEKLPWIRYWNTAKPKTMIDFRSIWVPVSANFVFLVSLCWLVTARWRCVVSNWIEEVKFNALINKYLESHCSKYCWKVILRKKERASLILSDSLNSNNGALVMEPDWHHWVHRFLSESDSTDPLAPHTLDNFRGRGKYQTKRPKTNL